MQTIINIVSEEFKAQLEEEILAIEEEIIAVGYPTIQCPKEVYQKLHDYHNALVKLNISLERLQ